VEPDVTNQHSIGGPSAGAYDDAGVLAFDFHHSMLADSVRTAAFHKAILYTVNPGDIVLDIGTGTGVLAMFAARAGARRVYAVEQGPIIDLARRVVAANGLEERITLIEGLSTEIELPELADVLVTETIGNAGLEEGIMAWAADAQRRLLSPGAKVVPSRVTVEAALVEVARNYAEFERWSDPLLGLDFSPLCRIGVNNLHPTELTQLNLMTEPVPLLTATLTSGATHLAGAISMTTRRAGVVHAIGIWFAADLCDGITLSNRPPAPVPSWEQAILPLSDPVPLAAGETVDVSIEVSGGGRGWSWQVGAGQPGSTVYGRTEDESG
jgi:protein arginine N-methyltransferase 1